jgi:hypothetical protein
MLYKGYPTVCSSARLLRRVKEEQEEQEEQEEERNYRTRTRTSTRTNNFPIIKNCQRESSTLPQTLTPYPTPTPEPAYPREADKSHPDEYL